MTHRSVDRKRRRNSARIALATACTLTVGSLLSSCVVPEPPTPELDELQLGDTVVALALSPRADGVAADQSGYVVLVQPDGSIEVIETSGMENAQLDWTADGLIFADTQYDYFLADSLTRIPSPKTNFQEGLFGMRSSDGQPTIVGVYNQGQGEDQFEYVNETVVSTADSADHSEIEGAYFLVGRCDDRVAGVGQTSGEYLQGEYRSDDWFERTHMLAWLTGTDDGQEDVVSVKVGPVSGIAADDAPCVDNTLFYLAEFTDAGGGPDLALHAWNLDSGERQELPIRDESGLALNDQEALPYSQYGSSSIRNGNLEWMDGVGRVWQTSLESGVTTMLFQVEMEPLTRWTLVEFSESNLLVVRNDNDGEKLELITVDRNTGKELESIEIDDWVFDQMASNIVHLYSIAVPPGA